ncbi:MAG: potassium channel protein [Gemmatimonadales bacterium]|nr:MAG: potassium channel protein [Gemmatimonadales bacterium]
MPPDGPWRTFVFRIMGVILTLIVLVTVGTLSYWLIEGWSLADAAWMTVITITAVGYDEVRPLTETGRIFAGVLLAGGITLMGVWFALLTSALIEMDLGQAFRIRRNMKRIEMLKDHVIVCGGGRTGMQIVAELKAAGVPYLIIDRDAERAEQLRRADEQVLVLVADSTKDETLVEGRIGVARGLVACLSQDTDNLFVCLSARDLQPNLTIVARAYDEQTTQKLYVAGADHVVSPNVTGGTRMAAVLLRPQVVSFLDVVAQGDGLSLRLEEIRIPSESALSGHTLEEARIPQRTGLIVIAIRHTGDADREPGWRYNPGPAEVLGKGDTLIVMGQSDQLDQLANLVKPS